MKTTSTITTKYPGHNTQKTAFPLCALSSDTPNRDNTNLRKTDITMLQVDAIINPKLIKDYRLPTHLVIHTLGLIGYSGEKGKGDLPSRSRHAHPFSIISTGFYRYSVDLATKNAVEIVRDTIKKSPGIEKVYFTFFRQGPDGV